MTTRLGVLVLIPLVLFGCAEDGDERRAVPPVAPTLAATPGGEATATPTRVASAPRTPAPATPTPPLPTATAVASPASRRSCLDGADSLPRPGDGPLPCDLFPPER